MKKQLTTLAAGAVVLTAAEDLSAQYAPPPPPTPFAGFINEALRKNNPYLNAWDFGGSLRVRYEVRDGFAIAGVGAGATTSLDFRDHGADVNNSYLLEKLRFRVGYTDKWWGAFVEGRSSLAQDDERFASTAPPPPHNGEGPEQDAIDLHQAYVTVGNHKEFPLSLKVGRQELSYGEERLVGAFAWNNIGRVFDAAKVRWQNDWFGADFFVSRPVIPEDNRFNVDNDYDWFWGMYATSMKIPKNTFDFYFLARNASVKAPFAEPHPQFPQPSARDIYTLGVRFKSKPAEFGNWDYAFESAYQFGDFKDPRAGAPATRLDHRAGMVVAQGGYTFNDAWASRGLGSNTITLPATAIRSTANTRRSKIFFRRTTNSTVTWISFRCRTSMMCARSCSSSRIRAQHGDRRPRLLARRHARQLLRRLRPGARRHRDDAGHGLRRESELRQLRRHRTGFHQRHRVDAVCAVGNRLRTFLRGRLHPAIAFRSDPRVARRGLFLRASHGEFLTG